MAGSSKEGRTLSLLGLFLGPVFALAVMLGGGEGENSLLVKRMGAIAVWMAVWWITEPIPIPVTSLLPVVLLPVAGILKPDEVAREYMNSNIMLFLGGFIIALALERWELHRRLALYIISLIGTSPRRILLGVFLSTAFLSMWISNTATVMLMLPIGMALTRRLEEEAPSSYFPRHFSTLLFLFIAYGASLGGIATLIGTPPNIVLTRIYAINFPQAPPITFSKWLLISLPLSITFIVVAYWVLVKFVFPIKRTSFPATKEVIRAEISSLGKMTSAQRRTLSLFLLTALLWITRSTISFGDRRIPGWAELFGLGSQVDDGTVAICMAVLLFLLPSGEKKGERLMDWSFTSSLPWGILLLFGGGFAIAEGFKTSGLSLWLGKKLAFLTDAPLVVMVMGTSTLLTFLTEMTSNTATANLLLPILASLAQGTGISPLMLMYPATISASCAFMLPVATPPNAIVFSTGKVTMIQMVRAGLILNFIGIILVTLFTLIGVPWLER